MKTHNLINIHESSSSLILSVFYIVRIIIIIISIIVRFFPFYFLQKHWMTKKAPPPVLSLVKMTNMHSYLVIKLILISEPSVVLNFKGTFHPEMNILNP